MDWAWFKELRQEWPAVKAAKWAVVLALVGGLGIGFTASYVLYQSRVDLWKDRAQQQAGPSHTRITEITNGSSYTAQAADEWISIKKSEKERFTVRLPSGFQKGKVIVVKNRTDGNPAMNPVMVRAEADAPIDGF